MSGGIFLLQGDESLIEMREQAYDSEAVLQRLLAQYPNLLAGDQINRAEPRRWLLVAREMGVPGEEVGGDRWSLDHLFLDQDGVPTLVEVKRSADTRIRREVVGQMLDYAANAVVYWPVERLQNQFENTQTAAGQDPALALADVLGAAGDPTQFWQTVKTNLQAGKVRLVFVADEIPAELQRVVEFLNGQMDPAEVLAIEIRQFVGQEMRTLVPRLIGQKEKAQQMRGTSTGGTGRSSEETFLAYIRQHWGENDEALTKRIVNWCYATDLSIIWTQKTWGSFSPMISRDPNSYPFCVWYDPKSVKIELEFVRLMKIRPFDVIEKRMELLRRVNQFAKPSITPDKIDKRPSIQLALLQDEISRRQFFECFDWVVDEVRHHMISGQ